jgi:hypothetical protein
VRGDRKSDSPSIPTSTARSVRSSSQSISSSAKLRVSGRPQNPLIRSRDRDRGDAGRETQTDQLKLGQPAAEEPNEKAQAVVRSL